MTCHFLTPGQICAEFYLDLLEELLGDTYDLFPSLNYVLTDSSKNLHDTDAAKKPHGASESRRVRGFSDNLIS